MQQLSIASPLKAEPTGDYTSGLDDGVYWTMQERRMLKHMMEADGLQFMRYFFKLREGNPLLLNWHHFVIQDALQRVLDGEITRLILNVPPGYTKTELAVLNFIARGLAINPRSKYIHVSYSGELAHENSAKIKETIELPEYQELWPMEVRTDTKGKKRWFTEDGGGMMAAPAGGQITGFRAGRMEKGFSGAFIADDPVKPDDAFSAVKRMAVNNRFTNTMRSRLAIESVPMIVIMQRIHDDDLTGFLLRGGSGDYWHHLSIPAHLTDAELSRKYPKSYTHGRPITLDSALSRLSSPDRAVYSRTSASVYLPRETPFEEPLWPLKHTIQELDTLRTGDPYTFSSQMQQDPSPPGGGMFKDKYWKHYDILPPDVSLIRIYADTAQKTQERHDYSVFQCWAYSPSRGIFLVDQMRGKWEAPELYDNALMFWNKHRPTLFKPLGASCFKIEDKSSGSSLIQSLSRNELIPVEAIQRNRDKVFRAMGVVKYFASGYIHIPAGPDWIADYKAEFSRFSAFNTHRHDDQIDPTMDAVEDMLVFTGATYSSNALGRR